LDLPQWTAVLKLSTMWAFKSARQRAIEAIDGKTDPSFTKLDLALKYDIDDWLVPCYADICLRDRPLTLEEAEFLGFEKYHAIANIRETMSFHRGRGSATNVVNELVKWSALGIGTFEHHLYFPS
jgi:hypothetical protein